MWLSLLACSDYVDSVPAPVDLTEVSSEEKSYVPIDGDRLLLEISSQGLLRELEGKLGLEKVLPSLSGVEFEIPERPSTKWLREHHPSYRYLSEHLSTRIETISQKVKRDLVVELKDALAYPAGNVGRRFDPRWLNSEIAFFQLVGIVNRLDRQDFSAGHNCGEVRLIYRLAYQTEAGISSRLPFTFNIVYEDTDKSCSAVARKWVQPEEEKDWSEWFLQTPLNFDQLQFKQIELNAQIVRFPSGLETEFAGQAIYLLRVYSFSAHRDGTMQLVEVPLENTPDVQRLQNDSDLRQRLAKYISTHLVDIDNGVYQLPVEFLATEALSYSTLGINRLANKPFDVVFPPEDRTIITVPSTGALEWINSRDAIIDRLNNGSCLGCHQASTTAGFHFLGEDDPEISGVTNRLELPFSAHFHQDLVRRRQQLIAIANETEIDRFRPHSLLPLTKQVSTNQTCVPEQYRSNFQESALWSCSEGETCQVVVEEDGVGILFGQCLPNKDAIQAGNTCREGKIIANSISEGSLFNLHAYADTFHHQQLYNLPENKKFAFDSYNCRPTRIGVPLGRTYRRCTSEERSFGSVELSDIPSELCAVVGGSKFDSCVEKDFHSCLDSIVARGMVDSCHRDDFCREDYICQALPYQLNGVDTSKGKEIANAGIGFCTPTYFVFQLRLDGHPVPQ